MTSAYIGIDLCFAKKKRLPISICTWRDGRLHPWPLKSLPFEPPRGSGNAAVLERKTVRAFTNAAAQYIEQTCTALNLTPSRIAIDAPSSPRKEGERRRAAELAMDQAGINCFTTPSASEFEAIFRKVRQHLAASGAENRMPHANQLWMSVGFELYRALQNIAECVEVFPQATARVMGSGQVHKFKVGGVDAQLATVASHTGWPVGNHAETRFEDIAFAPAHDRLDAYLSAWVAALEEENRIAFGKPPEDVIWAPRIGNAQFSVVKQAKRTPRKPKPASKAQSGGAQAVKFCPACGKPFKRWPFGWDSHAAHTCKGLEAKGAEARKAEFKARFGALFR